MEKIIFDGKGARLGRLGSKVAKELLRGNDVIILNSEGVVISGKRKDIAEKIRKKQKMGRGGSLKGPKYPVLPDKLLKRMLRGMLPWDKKRGRDAYKRLRCYVGDGEKEISEGKIEKDDLKKVQKFSYTKPFRYAKIKDVVEDLK